MFSNLKQKFQTREGLMGVGSVALCFAMFALLGLGVHAFSQANGDNFATITVAGNGESFGRPDIAKFSFTIQKDAKSMNEAEKSVTADADVVIEKLKSAGVAEKDIKTEGFNAYPKYETKYAPQIGMPCSRDYCPPYNPGNPVITGYTVSHTYSVKVRDIEKAGDIAQLITSSNVSSVNGPDFAFDDEDKLSNDARAKAIVDAKSQARILSKQLGVRLGKIVDFQVSDNGSVYPMYAKGMSADAMESAPAPSIEPGQTDVKVQVQITYKIR